MIERPFWKSRLEECWEEVPIVWLSGVRRVGKTTLVESLGTDRIFYLNCDLPRVAEMVRDPELFFRECGKSIVVFDEIHQLEDPTRILKIGADLFPDLKLLATGSSTLGASRKFKDTLTGRKRSVHLTPVLWDELPAFGATLSQRLHRGGLPPALLARSKSVGFYREWLDSFFARDIQRLYGFRDIHRFNALLEYLLRQSGGLHEVTSTSSALGISRPTVESHLQAMEVCHAITVVRPFHGGGQHEIVKQPRIYGFDTGFVSFARGWDPLRPEDYGSLWEHLVLEHLQAHDPYHPVRYWRDRAGNEIDFIIARGRDEVDAIECKWDPSAFDSSALRRFRGYYPQGQNYLVTPSADPAWRKQYGELTVKICTPSGVGGDPK